MSVPEFWVLGHPRADHVVDITAVFDRKVAALQEHRSQTAHRGDELRTSLHGWARAIGKTHGLPDGHLGEMFLRVQR